MTTAGLTADEVRKRVLIGIQEAKVLAPIIGTRRIAIACATRELRAKKDGRRWIFRPSDFEDWANRFVERPS